MAKKKYEDYLKELQEKSKKLEYKPEVYSHTLEKKPKLPTRNISEVNNINDVISYANNNQKSYRELSNEYQQSIKDTRKKLTNITNKAKKNNIAIETQNDLLKPTLGSVTRGDMLKPIYSRNVKTAPNSGFNSVEKAYSGKSKNQSGELEKQEAKFDKFIANTEDYKDYKTRIDKTNELLRYSRDVAKVNEKGVSTFDKITAPFVSGFDNILNSTRNSIKDENGNRVVLPSISDIKSNKAYQESDSGLYKAYSNITQSVGNMAPGIIANTILPGAGSVVFGTNTFNEARNQALLNGYDEKDASKYALINAGLELGIGKALGGTSSLLGKSPVSKMISNGFANKFISNPTISNMMADMISEFGEEYVQEWLDPKVRSYILEHKDVAESWESSKFLSKENFYAGLMGAISAGLTNTPNAIRNQSNLNNQIDSIVTNIENNTETKLSKEEKQSIRKSFYDEYNKAIKPNTEINYDNITQNTGLPVTNKPILPGSNNTSNILSNHNSNNSSEALINEIQNKTKNNLKELKDIDYASIKDVAPLFGKKGDRGNNKQYNENYENFIRNNGIDKPILLQRTKDDTVRVYDGNHRLEIANRLGLKEIPIKFINENIKVEDYNEILYNNSNKTQNDYVESEFDSDYKRSEKIGKNNEASWIEQENGIGDNVSFRNSRTTEQNDRIFNQEYGDSRRPSSSAIHGGNIEQNRPVLLNNMKELDNSSFNNEKNVKKKNSAKSQNALPINNMQQSEETIKNLPINIKKMSLPKQLKNENIELSNKKILNPNEISKLTKENASSTPKLTTKDNVNKVGDGNSKFFDNILFKTDMLDSNSKKLILSDEDVKYYDKVTNKESLEKAYNKINNGGSAEVLNWNNKFQLDSEGKTKSTATATDIAEGWILMKQYQDAGDYDSMVQIAKTMRQIGTQAGQTIQAFNILERMTPEGMVKYAQSELSEAYDRMVKHKSKEWIDKHQKDFDLTPQEVTFIMNTMDEVSRMKDGYDKRVKLAEIQKLMTDKLPPEKGAGIKAWMRISMLFNPKTQVRNVLGNAVIAPVNYFSDLVSTVADKAISKKTGVRTTASTDIKQYTKGFKKGLFESYNDFKKGINTRDMQGNRFEIGQGKSFNNNNKIGKSLNRVDSLLSFMLDAGDRGFYEASFTNSINNQMKINKTTEVTQEMIDIATQEALSRTWQDNNNYTKFVLDIRKGLNKLNVKGYGLGDVLIPFAKTPANLTKAIVDYSPVGLISTINEGIKLNKSLNNGQYNAQMQHKFVQNLGKALAGSMLYVIGYALAENDIISGESDDDKDVANFMKNTLGISNYSIKIGNKSFTYDWAQPIATPLAIMANYSKNKEDGATFQENITSILDTGLNVLFEQSFLESMSDILSKPGEIGTKLEEQLLELPSRAVPTFMKQIADMVDGTTRTTFEKNNPIATAVNKVKAKLPVVSKTLAPSTDTMGREIQKYGGKNNIFNVFLNPANINTENISESAEEIYKIYKATGEKSVMPRVPEYSYKDKDGNEIKFTASDRSKFTNESGKIIDKEIANLMKTPEYKSMSNIEKAETIKSIVDYSYNIAKNKVTGIELSDSYEKAYNYSKIGNVSDYYLFKENIDVTTKDTKKTSIVNYLLDSDLEDKQIAYLYDIYYSSPETLNNIINANIPIKEYIKFNSADIEGEFDESKGRTKTNSKRNETIKYVNSLKLSIPQKAFLIRTKYKTYNDYDKNIVNYINNQNIGKLDKYKLIKEAQIDSYDKEIVRYVNSQSMTSKEKQDLLKEMGFTVRNGRVYY